MKTLENILRLAARRQDLVIVAFILMVVALMILPVPTWLMDVAIAVNITIALLFILLAVYLKSPLEFSTLPSAILIATLIRIAITIATSRLILLQADAGQIVQSFGTFVIAGNLVVGLVIFAIIAIAQFVVITRGAERVAEVAARFALDALPGKQMSIDSDLRAGDIDRHEARRRRLALEHESQYYGAMDGAMKFVKGDAIVSMIIIFVNLVGGILVGTMIRGMDISTAFATFALLTVGDGLASQIPALLVAVTGGVVVTRVTTETSDNLGADLARELVSSAQSLAIVAAALLALSIVPGFPTLTFLVLAAIVGGAAAWIWNAERRRRAEEATAEDQRQAETEAAQSAQTTLSSKPGETFTLRLAPELWESLDRDVFAQTVSRELGALEKRGGIRTPAAGTMVDDGLDGMTAAFDVNGAEAWRGAVPVELVFQPLGLDAADGDDVVLLPGLGQGRWMEAAEADAAARDAAAAEGGEAAPEPIAGAEALARVTSALIGEWASHAFGLPAAEQWLAATSQAGHDALVQQVRQSVSMSRVAEVVRLLMAEGVSVAYPQIVLEALLELAPRIEDPKSLADHVRLALSRPISAQFAGPDRTISAVVVELDLEDRLRDAIIETATGNRLALSYEEANALADVLTDWQARSVRSPRPIAVLTSFDVRRALAQFAVNRHIRIAVVAFDEIAPDFRIVPVEALNLSSLTTRETLEDVT
jgi:type III secretion protein V